MSKTIFIVFAALASCGAGADSQVLVVVNADTGTQIAGVASFHCTASAGGSPGIVAKPFDVPVGTSAPLTLPPAVTFAIVVPRNLVGDFSITVFARDAKGNVLASGTGTTLLTAGGVARVDVILGARIQNDFGTPADSGVDLASTDLAVPVPPDLAGD